MNSVYRPYTLIRRDRRTISIEVEFDGKVIVRAPKRLPIDKIEEFIAKKYDWICEHVAINKDACKKTPELIDGENITLLGKEYTIVVADCKTAHIENDRIILPQNGRRAAFKKIVSLLFLPYIEAKTREMAAKFGLQYQSVRLGCAKKRWGSCNAQRVIRYNLSLVLLPEKACLGVVAHELCHTLVMNHGRRFYALLYKIMPDYEETVILRKEYSAYCAFFSGSNL